MMDKQKIYPRSKDQETVYLKNVITDPSIIVGDYTSCQCFSIIFHKSFYGTVYLLFVTE